VKPAAVSPAEQRDWLRLARTENVGPVTFQHLLKRCRTAAAALDALPALARQGGRLSSLAIPSVEDAERELAAGAALGGRLLTSSDADFPARLAALDPPPPLIWALGDAALLSRPCVAVVGARIASAAGQRFARGLAHDLGAAGYAVVSGMARGIDGAAHEGSLQTGSIAVLGGGPDDIYPAEHRDLYRRLIEQGCLVSEHPPGRRATAKDFPRRNRIISGLSLAVVVVEAEIRSGSLITARLAAEQGREVLAVPGSPLDPRARGTNDLIRQGAAVCEGVEDVVRALEGLRNLGELERPPYDSEPLDDPDDASDALRDAVAGLLSPTPVSRDELVRATGGSAGAVAAALVELAIAGRAELLPGGLVCA
jgi:DNA processing protein